jgi:mannose-6-phosphate isomerase-like protein (cupin superfamily)
MSSTYALIMEHPLGGNSKVKDQDASADRPLAPMNGTPKNGEGLRVTSTARAEHYSWGERCDGWHLVRSDGLSVIEESIPPGAFEVRHFHNRSRQFFYVLTGCATIECDGLRHTLLTHDGLEVPPAVPHEVFNRGAETLRLLVVSQPPSHQDRVAVPPEPQ